MNLRVQAPWAKRKTDRKAETVASLLGKLHLFGSSPQAAQSVARAVLNFILRRLG